MRAVSAVLLALLLGPAIRAEQTVLECIADAWVDAKSEQSTNGRSPELWLLGTRRLVLLDFRFSVIPDWQVTRATLLLRQDALDVPKALRADVLPVAWRESEAHARAAADGVPWDARQRRLDEVVLRGKLSNVLSVSDKDLGWIAVELAPALVNRILRGEGHGLVLGDGRRLGAPRRFDSRETPGRGAYLVVEGTRRMP